MKLSGWERSDVPPNRPLQRMISAFARSGLTLLPAESLTKECDPSGSLSSVRLAVPCDVAAVLAAERDRAVSRPIWLARPPTTIVSARGRLRACGIPSARARACAVAVALAISPVTFAKSNPPDQCEQFKGAADVAFERGMQSADARQRIFATFCLPEKHPKAARLLETALADSSSFVRRAAAARSAGVKPQLLRTLVGDRDPYVRFWSLQVGKDAKTVDRVVDLFRASRETSAALPATGDSAALRAFEGPATAPIDLAGEPRGWLRSWPPGMQATGAGRLYALISVEIYWLGQSHDQRAIAPLLKVLDPPANPDNSELREAAVNALYGLVEPDPETPAALAAVLPVARFLKAADMNSGARPWAVELLEKWKAPESVPLLLEMLDHHDDWWVRDDAVKLLGSLRVKNAIPPLIKLLDQDSESSVPEALAKLAPESILPLIKALRSTSERARAAADALRLIGPSAREAVPELLRMAAKDDANDCSGLRALTAVEPASSRTVDAFLTFLAGGGRCLNWSVAELAARIRPVPAGAITRLRRFLKSPERDVRESAAVVLGAFGGAAAAAAGDSARSLADYRRTAGYTYEGDYDVGLGETHRSTLQAIEQLGPIDQQTRTVLTRRRDAPCRTSTSPSECEATRRAIVHALNRTQ